MLKFRLLVFILFASQHTLCKSARAEVGLEINEPPVLAPRSRETLQSGMVIAVEPKFVLPGIGAVGIKNTYFVRDDGLEKVTICEEKLIVL